MKNDLVPFFSPEGVAIIGASTNPRKLSHGILKNMTMYGYQGGIYPINPKADQILGMKCYPDVAKVPGVPAASGGSKLSLSSRVVFGRSAAAGLLSKRNAGR